MQLTDRWRKSLMLVLFGSTLFYSIFSQQVMADMFSWFKKYDVHLSPEIRGTIKLDGQPLANLTVFRELDYDGSYTDSTNTNADGQFFFPAKNIRSRQPGNKLDQSTIRQVISLDYWGKTYVLWYTSTPSIEPHATFMKQLGDLQCDLNSPEQKYSLPNIEYPDFPHGVVSICQLSSSR